MSEGWKRQNQTDGIDIYSRNTPGSNIREVLASATVEAPARDLHALLIDFDHYTDFMPKTLERCELLHSESGHFWVFQQLNLPFISDRYYTIRLQSNRNENPPDHYRLEWTLAEEPRYQRTGQGEAVRFNNGYWSLRELPTGATLVQYYVHTDPGHLWGWLVDLANSVAVPDVVKALKRRIEWSGD